MSVDYHSFILGRIELANRLNKGEFGGYYGDAAIILSAALSDLADLWPGKGKDRQRFVETWATYTRPDLNPNLISVSLLLDDLEKRGNSDLVEKVAATRPEAFLPWKTDTRVTGGQVDQPEGDLIALDSRLTSNTDQEH